LRYQLRNTVLLSQFELFADLPTQHRANSLSGDPYITSSSILAAKIDVLVRLKRRLNSVVFILSALMLASITVGNPVEWNYGGLILCSSVMDSIDQHNAGALHLFAEKRKYRLGGLLRKSAFPFRPVRA
jgi:hypothetical protein